MVVELRPRLRVVPSGIQLNIYGIAQHKEGRSMQRWITGLALVGVLWTITAAAQSGGIRFGSLEFEVLEGPDPIGLVTLLFLPEATPSLTYQIPQAPGGQFTTPWAITVGGGKVGTDTLIVLINSDTVATIQMEVMLRDAEGALNDGCTKTLTIEPKATIKKASRSLFPSCPSVIP
jgi:hypothetical protein